MKFYFKMGVWLAVKTWRGLDSSSMHQACEMDENSSFGDLSLRILGEHETIQKIELSSTNSKFKKWRSRRKHPFQFAVNLEHSLLKFSFKSDYGFSGAICVFCVDE